MAVRQGFFGARLQAISIFTAATSEVQTNGRAGNETARKDNCVPHFAVLHIETGCVAEGDTRWLGSAPDQFTGTDYHRLELQKWPP